MGSTNNNENIVYKRKTGRYSSHEIILRSIEGTSGKILDLGASDGLLYQELRNRGFEVTCVDYEDPSKISVPEKDYVFCNLEQYENLNLTEKYDYIILADVIEHLRNAPELLSYIKKFLKEDGEIIISVPNIAVWVYRVSLFLGSFDYTEKGTLDETHVRFYTKKTILNLMKDSHFKVEQFTPTSLPFEVVLKNLNGNIIVQSMEAAYYIFASLWHKLFAYQFVVKAKLLK
ncbi:MAG: class I SAM-dependent methyltransferase [Bacteriovoracaceae bacterium]|jgi:2-polyprenyl-3-methyl-5-hydroxy-6-metoxy-1,4-benzoquinol methylase|nr:class I SAM-dependent methyltransferase [Bacteriovoracaceae bacterium]